MTSDTTETASSAVVPDVTLNRNHIIWGIAYERDGRTVASASYFATRNDARVAKAQYRAAGLRAYVVRYTPVIDTRS